MLTTLRAVFFVVFLSSYFETALAVDAPVSSQCKPKRFCELSPRFMKKGVECRNLISDDELTIVFYEPEGFWLDNEKFDFARKIIERPRWDRFAGLGKDEIIDFGQLGNFGDFIYRRTIFRYEKDLMFVKSSPQQTLVTYYTCNSLSD